MLTAPPTRHSSSLGVQIIVSSHNSLTGTQGSDIHKVMFGKVHMEMGPQWGGWSLKAMKGMSK